MALPICFEVFHDRRALLLNWIVEPYLQAWTPCAWFSCHAIFWFSLCKSWSYDKPLSPHSSSLEIYIWWFLPARWRSMFHFLIAQWALNSNSIGKWHVFHIQADKVTFLWVFYMSFYMPKVHHEACTSISYPSHLGILQNVLDLLIWCFCLTDCLGMVWSCNVVLDSIFYQELSKGLVDEVWPSITYDHSRCSKPWEYHFMKHLFGVLGVDGPTW